MVRASEYLTVLLLWSNIGLDLQKKKKMTETKINSGEKYKNKADRSSDVKKK